MPGKRRIKARSASGKNSVHGVPESAKENIDLSASTMRNSGTKLII